MLRCAVFILFACFASACALADDHCSSDGQTASSTPPLTGAALRTWNDSTCTSLEDDLCREAAPMGNALVLCRHTTNVTTTAHGTFLALACHYSSDDASCHPTHHHHHEHH